MYNVKKSLFALSKQKQPLNPKSTIYSFFCNAIVSILCDANSQAELLYGNPFLLHFNFNKKTCSRITNRKTDKIASKLHQKGKIDQK